MPHVSIDSQFRHLLATPSNGWTDSEINELIEQFHPDLRDVVRRILAGDTIEEIANEIDNAPLFDSLECEEGRSTAEELRTMLASSLGVGRDRPEA